VERIWILVFDSVSKRADEFVICDFGGKDVAAATSLDQTVDFEDRN
jgi:hypothetical protein